MPWLVLTVVVGIIGTIALVVGLMGRSMAKDSSQSQENYGGVEGSSMKMWGLSVAGACAVIEVVLFMAFSVVIIPAGHIGVIYGFGGGNIVGKYENGTHFKMPWREVKKASAQVQRAEFDFIGDNSAVSIEAQPVYARVRVNYQLEPNKIVSLYKNVGPNWFHVLMEGRAAQDFKQITAKYHTVEITPNREKIRQETIKAMRQELSPYSIHIVDVQLANIGFPDAFTKAIEEKQVATQKALAAQAKVQQAQYEADQKVKTAEGEAKSTFIKAKAQANSNRLLSRSLTRNIIQYEWVQKVAPTITTQLVPPNSILSLPGGSPTTGK